MLTDWMFWTSNKVRVLQLCMHFFALFSFLIYFIRCPITLQNFYTLFIYTLLYSGNLHGKKEVLGWKRAKYAGLLYVKATLCSRIIFGRPDIRFSRCFFSSAPSLVRAPCMLMIFHIVWKMCTPCGERFEFSNLRRHTRTAI